MLWIGGNGQKGLGRGLEQQTLYRRLVLVRDARNLSGQGEDHKEVLDGQQVLETRLHPVPRRGTLTLRAMPITARVAGDVLVAAQRTFG